MGTKEEIMKIACSSKEEIMKMACSSKGEIMEMNVTPGTCTPGTPESPGTTKGEKEMISLNEAISKIKDGRSDEEKQHFLKEEEKVCRAIEKENKITIEHHYVRS